MMNFKHRMGGILVLISVSVSAFAVAAQQQSSNPPSASTRKADGKKHADQKDEGQRVFEQHCARCHTPPDGFSPRISGTIVRHMRVRASLSKEEEDQLLRFFNP